VRLVENAGSEAFISLAVGETKIVVRHPGRAHCKPGDQVRLSADQAHFVWFDAASGKRIG
jgi:ABC-type sugar transport system ATPase subunit